MSITKKILLFLPVLFLSVACANQKFSSDDAYTVPMVVGKKKIFVEIAKTAQAKRQGLSGRGKLKDNQGMLFDFSQPSPQPSPNGRGNEGARPGFWMKDMEFDLDLIWIRDGKIIGITPNVPYPKSPDDELPLYHPPADIDMALEVNAGWSERNNIKNSDFVKDSL